jgi:predicted phage tail protein
MGVLIVVNATATAIAWWRAPLGAILLLFGGLAFAGFALWSAGSHHAFAMATSGGPFLVAGVAVLVSQRRDRPE